MKKSRLLQFYVWGFLMVALVSLVWAELLVRTTIPYRDLYEMTGRKPTLVGNEWAATDAFAAFKGRPGFSYVEEELTKTINRHGFISTPDLAVKKPAGTVRIVFLGGSSTAGTGINLSDTETWPWRVAETLKKNFPGIRIEFINAAVGGYTSFESYGRLWSRIRFFEPDILVLNHGWNEMSYFQNGKPDEILQWRETEDGEWRFNRPRLRRLFEPLPIDPLIRHSQALTYVRLMLTRSSDQGEMTENDPSGPLAENFDPRGPAIFRDNLKLIKSAAAVMGAKLFVIKQPTLIVPDLPDALRKECGYHHHGFDHDAHVRAYNEIYREIDEEIVAADIIDLRGLSGRKELFYDHVHPTHPLGVNAFTERIAPVLSAWIAKLKLPPLKYE
ncbi:MAG: SGNH/GDSL hydrolase family protein [Candidatus Omnitrophica bacterium]|nr:SGNH/GDSL hydrolase family protein [Candidatus Omnitrophota bacterium]